jgi:peroxiredoxin
MPTQFPQFRVLIAAVATISLIAVLVGAKPSAQTPGPKVGDTAKDFELQSLSGVKTTLKEAVKTGPVVLVVLRGYPGYQCPLCTKQFGSFLSKADAFKEAKATVLFVYPGPADNLKAHAEEFAKGKTLPAHYVVLLDPDFTFTKAYDLRWEQKDETAYPSTFVIDGKQKITFAKVSTTHGDRADVADVIKALPASK